MSFSDEIISLGKSLSSGGAQYKTNELFQGIESEQIRLGKNPFVVVVYINSFDFEGLTDYVFLTDSFPSKDAAVANAHNLSNALLEYQLKQEIFDRTWTLVESQSAIPYLPKPKQNSLFKSVYFEAFKAVSGEFDRKYVITRAIQTNGNMIVGQSLFDIINSDSELWSYFVKIGESINGKQERPTPFFNG